MRLSEQQKQSIIRTIKSKDPKARVYLFGSRVDDSARGGDIDLLVLSEQIDFLQKIKIEARLVMELGDQKVDLVLSKQGMEPFARLALNKAIEL